MMQDELPVSKKSLRGQHVHPRPDRLFDERRERREVVIGWAVVAVSVSLAAAIGWLIR